MSLYTTEVRYICEIANGQEESSGGDTVDEILDNAWDKVFPQKWPIFDESYRPILCKKILKHYYTREIGFETVALWKLKLETKMDEIMPYYNELYKTTIKEFDPFRDVDYYREHSGNTGGVSNETGNTSREKNAETEKDTTSTSTGTTNRWDVYSDTPQGALTNVRNETYLTDARKIEGGSTDTTTVDDNGSLSENESGEHERHSDFQNTDDYLDHIYGKVSSASYMKLIKELRENIINIDMMIIDNLKELFMLLWA